MSKHTQHKTVSKTKIIVALLIISTVLISGITYTVSQTTPLKLDPEFVYVLPAYNTSIGFETYLYCNQFEWEDDNATTFTLYNTYLGSGTAIPELKISTIDGNLSFTSLSRYGCSFSLTNFGSNATVSLVGFGQEPNDVAIDGTTITNYTYTTSNDTLLFTTEGASVVITYPGSAFTADDAIAVAVCMAIIVLCICLALIFTRGKDNE